MKVVLLGPNGQLGGDVQRAHHEADEPFDLIKVKRDQLDVSRAEDVNQVLSGLDFDVLVNCTSYHKTDEVEGNAALAFAVNAHAVQQMAATCSDKGARFIHVSTDYVFGGDFSRAVPLAETDATAPVNVYGTSKAMGETLAALACDNLLVLRVASLFGVDGASGKGGNFVETMIRVGRERGALKVVNDQFMSPTATSDVARALVRAINEPPESGVYHAVNSGSASWYEFACEIIAGAGVEAEVTPCSSAEFPTRAMRPRYSVLDNTRFSDAVVPMPAWQDALSRYLKAKGYAA